MKNFQHKDRKIRFLICFFICFLICKQQKKTIKPYIYLSATLFQWMLNGCSMDAEWMLIGCSLLSYCTLLPIK